MTTSQDRAILARIRALAEGSADGWVATAELDPGEFGLCRSGFCGRLVRLQWQLPCMGTGERLRQKRRGRAVLWRVEAKAAADAVAGVMGDLGGLGDLGEMAAAAPGTTTDAGGVA